MRPICVWLLASFAPLDAFGADKAPEYLLGDLGVRVDLPPGWNLTRWSDWDLKADTAGPMFLEVWATDFTSDPTRIPHEAWEPTYQAKLKEMGAKAGATRTAARQEAKGDRAVVIFDYDLTLPNGNPAVLRGFTLPVDGKMFHLALVTPAPFTKKADATRADLLGRLDLQKPAPTLLFGAQVTGDGFEHRLPDDWRVPLASEEALVAERVLPMGITSFDGCWSAVRPRAAETPDVMVACRVRTQLGVVDEYSFAEAEEKVRAQMFGSASVEPGRMIQVGDAAGMIYDLHDKGHAISVVPYEKGVCRTWLAGTGDDLVRVVEATAQTSAFSGPHPVTPGEKISYYLSHRPTSPMVLGPALCLLVGGGLVLGAAALVATRRRPPSDE